MLKPTNDPIRAERREREAVVRETREALAAGGTQPFQVLRKLQQQIAELRDLVLRLPQVEGFQTQATGFGLAGSTGWRTIVALTVPHDATKNRVVIQASAQAAVLDTTSGGLTSTECRLLIGGVASPVIPAAKDAGNNAVNNVLVVSQIREITPVPAGGVQVLFQINPLNAAAYPDHVSNVANLSVYAGYSVQ